LWAGKGEDQNGKIDDCPMYTDAACRVEYGSGSAVSGNEYNFDCTAFAKKGGATGVVAYTQDNSKLDGFTVSAVLVHSGLCLSGVSYDSCELILVIALFARVSVCRPAHKSSTSSGRTPLTDTRVQHSADSIHLSLVTVSNHTSTLVKRTRQGLKASQHVRSCMLVMRPRCVALDTATS
jgi:hypothetical protein